ncbi:metallophosphoesterase [Staphylococcus simulans]|uniref:metallophosphoesterase n=1 Tax=Staphylococcus simulans TaxID=1286 RepID=UPI001E338B00|nr:metallophosphoesterase [Staphylococcus simulans]MCD8916273.1 metallophosphoesterase [Staphylococcus simulans]
MHKRLLAASDIHGHGVSLKLLLDKAQYNPGNDQLVLCGDYVNKGPDSEGTLALIQQLQQEGAIVLLGNHELQWLADMQHIEQAMHHKLAMTYQRLQQDGRKLKWRPLIESFQTYYETADYLFVHAGIAPNIPITSQTAVQLTGFYHNAFVNHIPGKIMIHGHVPTFRKVNQKGIIYKTKDAINIDTGAGHGEYLTLYDVTNDKQYRVKVKQISI